MKKQEQEKRTIITFFNEEDFEQNCKKDGRQYYFENTLVKRRSVFFPLCFAKHQRGNAYVPFKRPKVLEKN